ncbi:MAG: 4Fe-4S binding protein [Gordonibacter urolithinfaciens]
MGSFKLGKMTLKSLFGKPETIQYPAEQKTPPPGLKGHVTNNVDACILCGICMKRCPCDAIRGEEGAHLGHRSVCCACAAPACAFAPSTA